MSSIPIYFMSSFLLPKWVSNRLDRIRRRFIWGYSGNKNGIALIAWSVVCLPKRNGGMGVSNLLLRNYSLLLRWWWRLYRYPNSLWTQTTIALRSITRAHLQHRIWMRRGSFFWMQLLKIRYLFDWSTYCQIGTGASISYWFDSWSFPTRASVDTPVPANRNWSLQSAVQYEVEDIPAISNTSQDMLLWRWNSNTDYSAKSVYEVMVAAGKTNWQFQFIWQLKIPPTVRVFAYLCLKNKLLTHEVMARRGFNTELQCEVCQACSLETTIHLFFRCNFAITFWHNLTRLTGCRMFYQGDSVQAILLNSLHRYRDRRSRSKWGVIFFAGCWFIWKNRNGNIFEGRGMDPGVAADHAIKEAMLWLRYC